MNTIKKVLVQSDIPITTWSQLFLEMISKVKKGELTIITPDGIHLNYCGKVPGERVTVVIVDWKFCEMLFMKGDIGLGESYIEGLWECENINSLIRIGVENVEVFEKAIRGSFFKIAVYRLKHFFNRNSKKGSQKNIHAHYDLGNEFYKIWLDPSMTYSSGLFKSKDQDLETAQQNKYEEIFNQLKIKEGDHLLEVGCGWGGFMEYSAKRGVKVTGVTISTEQCEFAKLRLAQYGDLAIVKFQDYRDITGEYDHIISIEMFEALGKQYWNLFFKKLYSILRPGGKLIIQSITINNNDFAAYRAGTDFIQQYIFPGGMLPSPKVFNEKASEAGFVMKETFEFGDHYASTLKVWEENFKTSLSKVQALGFDNKFIRTWHFYLKYCQGAFEAKKISVYQFNLEKKQGKI